MKLLRLFGQRSSPISDTAELRSSTDRTLPTVEFDRRLIDRAEKSALKRAVAEIEDLRPEHHKRVLAAAITCAERGGDLAYLCDAILGLRGNEVTERRIGEIARHIQNGSRARTDRKRRLELGIEKAIWMYSGTACIPDARNQSKAALAQDAAHKAAGGRTYDVATGMMLEGRWTMPGEREGCRCTSRPVIAGFEDRS